MFPRRASLASIALAAIASLHTACIDRCPGGDAEAVRDFWGNSTGDYVCVPRAEPTPVPSTSPSADAGTSADPTFIDLPDASAADTGRDTSVASCMFLAAGSTDVVVVPKSGPLVEPDAGVDPPPPDADYTLVQASAYVTGATPFPVTQLRAHLTVAGAKLVVGAEALTSTSQVEPNESFTLVLSPGSLTKVCATYEGSVSASLFPGSVGSQESARARWNAATGILRLVVRAPTADVELLFVRR